MKGESGLEWVRGQDEQEDGWRDKRPAVLEFWTPLFDGRLDWTFISDDVG